MDGSWQERLKAEVPRERIPDYLTQLQALVAELRRWREAQRVPEPRDLEDRLTPLLREHAGLTVAYVTDPGYAQVVERALEA